MKVIEPSVELLPYNGNEKEHVCKCARVCYGKKSGDDDKLYNSLIKNKHWSVFRHITYYAIVSRFTDNVITRMLSKMLASPFEYIGIRVKADPYLFFVAYNGNFALDYPEFHETMKEYHVSTDTFSCDEIKRYTFMIVTQISTSRELNRVSPNNITEQSTRYVDLENGTICRPYWLSRESVDKWNVRDYYDMPYKEWLYLDHCNTNFIGYKELLQEDVKKEDARGILPLDTATVVIYTYSVEEWKHIIKLRANKKAHPNAQIIANMIKDKLKEL